MNNSIIRNKEIRERMKNYTQSCRVPFYQIGIDAGMTEKRSMYLVSRFLRGMNLNDETLDMFEEYLNVKNF